MHVRGAMLAIVMVVAVGGATPAPAQQTPGATTELEGVWIAQSMTRDGVAVTADVLARTRYTFKGKKLLVRGNFGNDREDELTFTIDASDSPKFLDLTDANGYPTTGIYELKDDVLTICLSRGERPVECASSTARVTRVVLRKTARGERLGERRSAGERGWGPASE